MDCCSELCFVLKGEVKKLTQTVVVTVVATDLAELMSPAAVTATYPRFLQTPSNHSCSQLYLHSVTASVFSHMDCVHMDE